MATFLGRKAAVTLGVLALTLAGGGIAAAAQPSTKSADLAQPAARAVDSQPAVSEESARLSRSLLKKGATPLAGTVTYTVVNANATKARGTGVVIKYGVGQYEVQFPWNVTAGAYVATIGRSDSCCVPPGGEVSVAPRLGTPNGVFIQIRDYDGNPSDRGFYLIVHI
ncbi:hypothetical protein ACFY2R_12615 [Micromonospora olivasterospora]|uniref:Secreted protein n=1 Tax=Micromonospora olivasterospora TaxID=1880 RepID=A0A562ICR8_MICOL|nr:hypothetical protein [Micromonospora olivasterospora]TWH68780.1 hypothetical protein JD77_03778 [Micromonospora olivasterospora]